jgi:type II restriction enzyme
MNKDFNLFMSQLYETNATLDFYCDFEKIHQNVEEIAINLNTLQMVKDGMVLARSKKHTKKFLMCII